MSERKLTEALINSVLEDLKTGRLPMSRLTLSDREPGLRVIIRGTGVVTFHAQYEIEDRRPYMKIGNYPEMTLSDARELMKTIRFLVDHKIDPYDRLQERRTAELLASGTAWRPQSC